MYGLIIPSPASVTMTKLSCYAIPVCLFIDKIFQSLPHSQKSGYIVVPRKIYGTQKTRYFNVTMNESIECTSGPVPAAAEAANGSLVCLRRLLGGLPLMVAILPR